MTRPALKPTLYEQWLNLPDNLVGEIIANQLYSQPRPAAPHALAAAHLGMKIGSPFSLGDGGPGGWWILLEPEIHFKPYTEIFVPDIAGWRRERLPSIPNAPYFELVPDWLCEVLSPSTTHKDRQVKMPLYAQYGVRYAWLLDPLAKTLEAFSQHQNTWTLIGSFRDNDLVSVAPFAEISFSLHDLWC